jgi:hypothetical protein
MGRLSDKTANRILISWSGWPLQMSMSDHFVPISPALKKSTFSPKDDELLMKEGCSLVVNIWYQYQLCLNLLLSYWKCGKSKFILVCLYWSVCTCWYPTRPIKPELGIRHLSIVSGSLTWASSPDPTFHVTHTSTSSVPRAPWARRLCVDD